jgi:hypothetical protein
MAKIISLFLILNSFILSSQEVSCYCKQYENQTVTFIAEKNIVELVLYDSNIKCELAVEQALANWKKNIIITKTSLIKDEENNNFVFGSLATFFNSMGYLKKLVTYHAVFSNTSVKIYPQETQDNFELYIKELVLDKY